MGLPPLLLTMEEAAEGPQRFQPKAGKRAGKRDLKMRAAKFEIPSLDKIFSYETTKVVKILDRRLGAFYYAILLLIVFYIVVGVMILGGGYLAREKARGSVSTVITGKTYSKTPEFRVFDGVDAIDPPLEPGAVFVPTRIVLTPKQEQKVCKTSKKCKEKTDCKTFGSKEGTCEGGFCSELNWCPDEDKEAGDSTKVYLLEAGDISVWFKALIQFTQLDKTRPPYSTMLDKNPTVFPAKFANAYLIGDLLKVAETTYDDTREKGAMLLINLLWDCDLDDPGPCQVKPKIARIDKNKKTRGFSIKRAIYYYDGDTRKRDIQHCYGVRLFVTTEGAAVKFDFGACILQFASGLALLAVATGAADGAAMAVMAERKHYKRAKYLMTDDFNESDED